MKYFFLCLVIGVTALPCLSQEFRFDVKINTPRLQTADPTLFVALESQIRELLNNRSWTSDNFADNERITGNVNITIREELSSTSFRADLDIQAIRPVFGTNYETTLLNHSDKEVVFEFEQSRPVVYSDNIYTDNLTSIVAFYMYYILGLDYDSFSLYGGDSYYQLANEVINVLPSGFLADKNSGWSSSANGRNRYFMVENILSPKSRPYRRALYEYHRLGLDLMASDAEEGKSQIMEALKKMETVNSDYPNAMIIQMFANAKAQEVTDIYTLASRNQKNEVYRIMTGLDPANRNKYIAIRR
ncbi:MAG: DUF4835 family protein [Saprospiraceae bacterium]|nr:DUF4835 family protein [Saprospiraceae bacterium]